MFTFGDALERVSGKYRRVDAWESDLTKHPGSLIGEPSGPGALEELPHPQHPHWLGKTERKGTSSHIGAGAGKDQMRSGTEGV